MEDRRNGKTLRPGLMVAMFDVPAEIEEDFNTWYDEEHIPEKVGRVPGFLRARRYRALDGRPSYLAIYELQDIDVLEDPSYVDRYRNATDATRAIKAKAKTFYRNTYVQIGDQSGVDLDGNRLE